MYTKGLYLNVYTAVYGRAVIREIQETRRKMDMEAGNGRRCFRFEHLHGGYAVDDGGRVMRLTDEKSLKDLLEEMSDSLERIAFYLEEIVG